MTGFAYEKQDLVFVNGALFFNELCSTFYSPSRTGYAG